jgi:hypothetical protein
MDEGISVVLRVAKSGLAAWLTRRFEGRKMIARDPLRANHIL